MNTKNLLIYCGGLLTIIGITLFQDNYLFLYSALILGVILVLLGLRKKEEQKEEE